MCSNSMIKTVKTDDFEMDFFSFGHGDRTMLIIPGVSVKSVLLSAAAIANIYSMFSEDYTVYLFDYRKGLPDNFGVEDMANDLAKAMKVLGLSDAYIMGTSHGGMMAQYLAKDYPELVSKMVLISSLSKQNPLSTETFSEWVRLAENGDRILLNRDVSNRVYGKAFFERNFDAIKAMEDTGEPDDIKRFRTLAKPCGEMNMYDELDQIKVPVMVICAWGDRVLGWEASLEIAEKLSCTIHIVEGFGHSIYDEYAKIKDMVYGFFEE